jgi:hypothetical protein
VTRALSNPGDRKRATEENQVKLEDAETRRGKEEWSENVSTSVTNTRGFELDGLRFVVIKRD